MADMLIELVRRKFLLECRLRYSDGALVEAALIDLGVWNESSTITGLCAPGIFLPMPPILLCFSRTVSLKNVGHEPMRQTRLLLVF